MALVESSHYTDEDGLRQQVGQYSTPPPVRLQRGGFGKLAVAVVAAMGSGAAMFFAVTATPGGSTGDEVVLTLSAPAESEAEPAKTPFAPDQSVDNQNLGLSQQLALLAGAGSLPVSGQTSELQSEPGFVDLNTSILAQGLAQDLIKTSPDDTGAGQGVGTVETADPESTALEITAGAETSDAHFESDAEHRPLRVETRVPEPRQKPVAASHETQLASTKPQLASRLQTEPEAAPEIRQETALETLPQPGAPREETPVEPRTSDPQPGFQKTSTEPATINLEPAVARPSASQVVLNPAPWAKITERSANGLLPVTGPAGETSRQYYARPHPASDKRPRISIVIGGLGLSQKATTAAIDQLPPEVTLAFAPYGKNLQTWINKARSRGHEVLLELPMEPFDYPSNDPGPFTLLTNNDAAQNTQRLEWLLAQFNGYVGVTNYLGAKFTSTPEALLPVLRTLDERGLLVLDDGTSHRSLIPSLSRKMHVPYATASRTVDLRVSRSAIDDALLALEDVTRRNGAAIGMGYAYPVTIDRILLWADTLDQKGFVMVPVSANVKSIERDTSFDRNASTY